MHLYFIDDLFEETVRTTERLTLRLMKEEDAEDIFEIRGDRDTAGDAGIDCMKSLEEVRQYIQNWDEDYLAIVLGDEVISLIESYCFMDSDSLFDSTFLGYYISTAKLFWGASSSDGLS